MKQNYQLMLDRLIEAECADGRRPTLLLHACCAPCSSYVLEYLSQYFAITLFFYNPNIPINGLILYSQLKMALELISSNQACPKEVLYNNVIIGCIAAYMYILLMKFVDIINIMLTELGKLQII